MSDSNVNRKNLFAGVFLGASLTAAAAVLMGQSASTPVKSEPQYFVSGEGDAAHLWVREGVKIRCIGHGECTTHQHHDDHDHKEGDGHSHDQPKP